jgi:hypothetical protein
MAINTIVKPADTGYYLGGAQANFRWESGKRPTPFSSIPLLTAAD